MNIQETGKHFCSYQIEELVDFVKQEINNKEVIKNRIAEGVETLNDFIYTHKRTLDALNQIGNKELASELKEVINWLTTVE